MKFNTQRTIADYSPKGYFVEYPFLMDLATRKFIDDFQDSFVQKNGKFVLHKRFSKKSLKELLSHYLSEIISRICSERILTHPEYKNVAFIVAETGIERREKIALLENDIDIRIEQIEAVFQEIFDEWFLKKSKVAESIKGVKFLFLKHKFLLSSDWKKILEKKAFGRSNFFDLTESKKCLKETTNDEKIRSLSKRENDLIVNEAAEWAKKEIEEVRI